MARLAPRNWTARNRAGETSAKPAAGRRDPAVVRAQVAKGLEGRRRELVTPEGLALPLTVASRGARAGALLLDLAIVFGALLLIVIGLVALGVGMFADVINEGRAPPAAEAVVVALIVVVFLARYFYFIGFELGPRGATPGKRLVGIRVAARPGGAEGAAGRLTAEAIIARNLLRDVEVFLPLSFLLGGGWDDGVAGLAATVWLAIFVLFPCFNRDALRAGDIIAGTWVVEAERSKLVRALSLGASEAAIGDVPLTYRFGAAELAIYGEHELQVLESVLRTGDAAALREVAEAICRKIGWELGGDGPGGDERAFLEAFYSALRAQLERGLRFGRRKKDKFG